MIVVIVMVMLVVMVLGMLMVMSMVMVMVLVMLVELLRFKIGVRVICGAGDVICARIDGGNLSGERGSRVNEWMIELDECIPVWT